MIDRPESSLASESPKPPLTFTQWLVCIISAIGFSFDIYVLLMLPLILKPALQALGGHAPDGSPLLIPGNPEYKEWARTLFFVPAIAGGVVGLLGGYLTDLLGRRRVLTFSILLYALSALASGYAQSLPELLFWRCLIFVGVCVEFVAAVAWLAELFPDPIRREKVLGYTQAFSSLGGLLVAQANIWAAQWAADLPAIRDEHVAWRYTLISGVIPAIPLILIRPFLPESPEWQRKRDSGMLKRPNILQLFTPELVRTTLLTTLVFASSYGIAFGSLQQLPQILPGHKEVRAVAQAAEDAAKAAATSAGKPAPSKGMLNQIRGNATDQTVASVQFMQEVGGLVGRVLLALLTVWIVSRRSLMRLFQLPALIFIPFFFWWISKNLQGDTLGTIKIGIFVAGLFTVGQFSFWGNYIPLVFPLHLRGTGESFAANIGGRILGVAAAWIAITLSVSDPPNPGKIALVSAAVAGGYALVGAILTQWLPEPKEGSLHE